MVSLLQKANRCNPVASLHRAGLHILALVLTEVGHVGSGRASVIDAGLMKSVRRVNPSEVQVSVLKTKRQMMDHCCDQYVSCLLATALLSILASHEQKCAFFRLRCM